MVDFETWVNKCCEENGSLVNFCNVWKYPIPYTTALKWKCGYTQPTEWVQKLLEESYQLIMYRKKRAEILSTKIRDEVGFWDGRYCRELCYLAEMVNEWDNASLDEFESIIYKAAEKLGVLI